MRITMKEIYNKPGIGSLSHEGDKLIATWQVLHNKEALYESCKLQLELVVKDEARIIVLDMQHATGTPPQEVQSWFQNELFPNYKKNANFLGIINILPNSIIGKMGIKSWKQAAESDTFGFKIFDTDSIENARKLAQELTTTSV